MNKDEKEIEQKKGTYWRGFKGQDKPYNDVKTIEKFRESGVTIEDMKKEAESNGWNAIAIRHDVNIAYFKKFDILMQCQLKDQLFSSRGSREVVLVT